MDVSVRSVDVSIDGLGILREASLDAESGRLVALVGPNGSGKSTLLRAIYRSLPPDSGRVLIDGEEVWHMSALESARRTAVVLQDDSPDFEFTVREVVELGRLPHRRAFERPHPEDREAVDAAIAQAGVGSLADRCLSTLSGGERQRVFVARALAQRTGVLVLDEPTNHLDLLAQAELLDLLEGTSATVIVALHDLNLAAAHADHVVLLQDGRVSAAGAPHHVLTPERIETVYGVRTELAANSLTGSPVLHFGAPIRDREQPRTHPSPIDHGGRS